MGKTMKTAIALLCTAAMFVPICALGADDGGNETTDCVEFGSYPQTEVVSQASDSGVYGKDWGTESDYIIDASLYNTLKTLSEDKWNANGDATVGGNQYRRIKADDATYSTSGDSNYYDWSSSDTYHYFKYEPIKWKVLGQDGSDVFLLSETALDDQRYNTKITNITWETSTIRSWLNGYGSGTNLYGTDYSSNNFIDTAFTSAEQAKIKTTALENKDNNKSGTEGGNDTSDKIFLLSEDEVYGSNATGYGFASDYNTRDKARQTKSSTYAKAMGTSADCEDNPGNCDWWLRSPGSYTGLFILVRCNGGVYRGGQHADSKSRGVRPALRVAAEAVYGGGDKPLSGITLGTAAATMRLGNTKQLEIICTPADTTDDKTAEWSSGDEKIASVSEDGLVTALSRGKAVITATVGKFSAVCTVTVIGLRDASTGITVTNANDTDMAENITLSVSDISAEKDYSETIPGAVVYDIHLEKSGKTVQPDTAVDVEIPVDDSFVSATVYREEGSGNLTNMNATYTGGKLTFQTGYSGIYIIAKGHCRNGHTVVTDAEKPATCTASGLTEGKHCAVCGKVLVAQGTIPATGHHYMTTVVAPTCTESGYTLHACACGESYTEAETPATEHNFVWVMDTEPTPETTGTKHEECTICHERQNEDTEIRALMPGHKHSYTDTVIAPTCTADGYTHHVCDCGYTCDDNFTTMLEHEGALVRALEATCVSAGYTGDTVCVHCGKVLSTGKTIPVSEHYYVNGICEYCDGERSHVPGDITGEGDVNISDLVRLMKYISGADIEYILPAVDANGDGKKDILDLVHLMKYLAGVEGITLK